MATTQSQLRRCKCGVAGRVVDAVRRCVTAVRSSASPRPLNRRSARQSSRGHSHQGSGHPSAACHSDAYHVGGQLKFGCAWSDEMLALNRRVASSLDVEQIIAWQTTVEVQPVRRRVVSPPFTSVCWKKIVALIIVVVFVIIITIIF